MNDLMWKSVPKMRGIYECSNYGQIRRLKGVRKSINGFVAKVRGGILTPYKDADGYLEIKLSAYNKRVSWKISRLVAYLFVPGWDDSLDVNHIDFNKENNYYLNLNYKTKKDNILHSALNGRFTKNANHFKKRKWRQPNITVQHSLSGDIVKEYPSLKDAALAVNGGKSLISRAIIGRSKTAYGYKWSYKK